MLSDHAGSMDPNCRGLFATGHPPLRLLADPDGRLTPELLDWEGVVPVSRGGGEALSA